MSKRKRKKSNRGPADLDAEAGRMVKAMKLEGVEFGPLEQVRTAAGKPACAVCRREATTVGVMVMTPEQERECGVPGVAFGRCRRCDPVMAMMAVLAGFVGPDPALN